MYDDRTVPMSQNPWGDFEDENQKNTVIDGGNDSTVPMDDGGMYPPPPSPGGYDRTVVDDTGPFQRTNPQDHPTPVGRGYPAYPIPPSPGQQQPFAGGEESATVIMPAGLPETIPLAWLAVVEGPGAPRGEVFRLGSDTVIGRVSGNSIVLNGDPAISSRHLKIKLETSEEDAEQKVFVLYDQGSANGTYVGEYQECKAAEQKVYRHVLEDGEFLLVGETLLVFKEVNV